MPKQNAEELLSGLSAGSMRKLHRALAVALEELGPNTPIRQVMALLLIAMANKGKHPLGVRDIDKQLGDLASGSASKLLRSMMHVETEKKQGIANTVTSVRDPEDLRRWDLFLTGKGAEALSKIISALEGKPIAAATEMAEAGAND